MTALAVISCILGSAGLLLFWIMVEDLVFNGGLLALIGLSLLGGQIAGNIKVGKNFGAPGIAIFNLIGIILGIISLIYILKNPSSSSSSGSSMIDYTKSRANDPHTCNNCTGYSHTKGECRSSGRSMSVSDSCSNWH